MKAKTRIICHIDGKPVTVLPGQELPEGISSKDLAYLQKHGKVEASADKAAADKAAADKAAADKAAAEKAAAAKAAAGKTSSKK